MFACFSETDTYHSLSMSSVSHDREKQDRTGRGMDEREQYRELIESNLEYAILLQNNPYDGETIGEIIELILDTVCSKRRYIGITRDDVPRDVVKSQVLKLNSEHIEYVLSSFKENVSKVRR